MSRGPPPSFIIKFFPYFRSVLKCVHKFLCIVVSLIIVLLPLIGIGFEDGFVSFEFVFKVEVEVEDAPSTSGGVPVQERNLPILPVTVNKENREDLEEKFGKFGLPQHTSRERHSQFIQRDRTRMT